MKDDLRIKVAAIAKDEAAYISSWIFHHIHFGFDEIEVIINRTSDNSIDIIKSISKIYPQVTHSTLDWIDFCAEKTKSNIQEIAYALTYEKSKESGFTHILFIDIDEFWTPLDFKTNIKEFVKKTARHASISFQWLCELGIEKEFSCMQQIGQYYPNCMIKTLISYESIFSRIRIHTPAFSKETLHVLADGSKYIPNDSEPQLSHPKSRGIKKAFIIHRLFRSEREYISALLRGNPEDPKGSLKENREGFFRDSPYRKEIEFTKEHHSLYISKLAEFIEKCHLRGKISIAEDFVKRRYEEALNEVPRSLSMNPESTRKILSGLKNQTIIKALELSRKTQTQTQTQTQNESQINLFENIPQKIKSQLDSGEILREIALSFESQNDYQTAYKIMDVASRFRPGGPFIKEKKEFYKKKLNAEKK